MNDFLDYECRYLAPKLLVLMAVYNGEEWIDEQLKSISCQLDVNANILISDDSSVDKTVSVVKKSSVSEGIISVVECKQGSGSAGQNFMRMFRNVDSSNFNYIAFSDQDDIWLGNKLINAVTKIQSSNSVGYSSSVVAFWPSGKKKVLHQSPNVTCVDYLFEGAGQGCTFVLTADFFRKVQKFCIENEEITKKFYYHDWLVYLLSRCWGEKWFFDDRPGMNYRQHSDNDTGARSGYSSFLRRLNLIANGWYKKQIEVAIELSKRSGNKNASVARVETFMNSKKTFKQRLSFAIFLGKSGRRKFIDRLVLAFSVVVGWI